MEISETNKKLFCEALINERNESIEKMINTHLISLDKLSNNESFEGLKEYLLSMNCIDEVDISGHLKRSDPPIKELIIKTISEENEHVYRLSLRVKKDGIRFSNCKSI